MKPVALVTGGARGIGSAIAIALARRGYDIAIADLESTEDASRTLEDAAKAGARTAFVAADIADLADHACIVETAHAMGGPFTTLVNNAGVSVSARGDVLDVTPQSYDRVLNVNLRGTFFLTQAFARRMLADTQSGHPRSIVTITSANATLASADRAEYCLAKTALSMKVKVFALRLAEAGIAVYEVRPGVIRTAMTAVAREKYDRLIEGGLTPVRRWGEPQDVGKAVATLAAGEIPFATGGALHVDGGLHIHRL